MNAYRNEWIAVLLKENFPGWLIADDGRHVFIKIPDDQHLDLVYEQFPEIIKKLQPKIKSKKDNLTFFISTGKDSKFYELKGT